METPVERSVKLDEAEWERLLKITEEGSWAQRIRQLLYEEPDERTVGGIRAKLKQAHPEWVQVFNKIVGMV